ncbi:MAG: DUF2927 domain-containing protein [Rhodospirillales bacterium]
MDHSARQRLMAGPAPRPGPGAPGLSLILALVVALVLVRVPARAAEDQPPSVDDLVQYFDTIVFKSEFKGVAASKVVKKWTQPLRVAIRAFEEETTVRKGGREVVTLQQVKVKKPHLRFIKKHLTTLVRATGLKTEDAKKIGEAPNFLINFVPRRQMGNPNLADAEPKLLARLAAEGGCYFLIWSDGTSGEISQAVVVVNAERLLIRINHCLLEEMTQSLGLPNDTNIIASSIFSDQSRRTDLTATDIIVLKTLYDPRMKVGLPRAEALPVASEIIAGMVEARR